MEDEVKHIQYGIALIVPTLLLLFSIYFKTHIPKKRNALYGYRTGGSARNQDTWNEANLYFSKVFFKVSVFIFNLELLIMLFAKYLATLVDSETLYHLANMAPLIIFPLSTILLTEIHMSKIFTKEGIRKSSQKS